MGVAGEKELRHLIRHLLRKCHLPLKGKALLNCGELHAVVENFSQKQADFI
jgi:hypothetical protein